MSKICLICGKPLDKGRRSYCGDSCAREAERRRERQRNTPIQKETPKAYQYITCMDCGKAVLRHIRCIRCADCQDIANKKTKADYQKRKAVGASRKIGGLYPCEVCSEMYILNSGSQRYCSECSEEARRKNDNAASRAWNRKAYSTPEGKTKKEASRQGKHTPIIKTCEVCGRVFNALREDVRFCKKECRMAHARKYAKEHHDKNKEMANEKARKRNANLTKEQREEINRKARENYEKNKEERNKKRRERRKNMSGP